MPHLCVGEDFAGEACAVCDQAPQMVPVRMAQQHMRDFFGLNAHRSELAEQRAACVAEKRDGAFASVNEDLVFTALQVHNVDAEAHLQSACEDLQWQESLHPHRCCI